MLAPAEGDAVTLGSPRSPSKHEFPHLCNGELSARAHAHAPHLKYCCAWGRCSSHLGINLYLESFLRLFRRPSTPLDPPHAREELRGRLRPWMEKWGDLCGQLGRTTPTPTQRLPPPHSRATLAGVSSHY